MKSSQDIDSDCREEELLLRSEPGLASSSSSSQQESLQYGDAMTLGAVHRTSHRYMGHSNVQTDIKEANFLGGNDEMVAACSDDGHVFIYNAETGCPVDIGLPILPLAALSLRKVLCPFRLLWKTSSAMKPSQNCVSSKYSHVDQIQWVAAAQNVMDDKMSNSANMQSSAHLLSDGIPCSTYG